MGKCKYCHQEAGFLKSKHKACEEKNNNGKKNIVGLIESTITTTTDFQNLQKDVELISESSYIGMNEVQELIAFGFDNAVEKFLEDGILSKEEEERINEFVNTFFNTENQENYNKILNKKGTVNKVIKSSIIRNITEGVIPETRIVTEQLPFIFQKTEKLIWVFYNVKYFEQVTKTHYRGGSHGASIRIAKGVYYRANSFKGYPVKEQEMKYIDSGIFALTSKHVYFYSSNKTFKIPFGKIITIQPYEDGIGLQKDGASSKPQVFKGIDGWFVFNIVNNLNQI